MSEQPQENDPKERSASQDFLVKFLGWAEEWKLKATPKNLLLTFFFAVLPILMIGAILFYGYAASEQGFDRQFPAIY